MRKTSAPNQKNIWFRIWMKIEFHWFIKNSLKSNLGKFYFTVLGDHFRCVHTFRGKWRCNITRFNKRQKTNFNKDIDNWCFHVQYKLHVLWAISKFPTAYKADILAIHSQKINSLMYLSFGCFVAKFSTKNWKNPNLKFLR